MTKDQAFSAAQEEWESMNWRERVAALDPHKEWDAVEHWLQWRDKKRPSILALGNLKYNLSFEAFLNHAAETEWIGERAVDLYTEAQADEADRLYDMKKEEGW